MIRHSETAKMSRTSSFFTLGGQLASSGGRTLISDSLKLQLYQHRGQLNLLKVEVYLKPPHLNIALWGRNWVDFEKLGLEFFMKFWKISPLESTQFLQIWPFFVGIGLTLKWPKKVNPIPTKSTQFLQWIWSQPNSYKCWFQPNSYNQVNPITANLQCDFDEVLL